ncbi:MULTISPECIES: WbqC family protein [unclassified Clostridium]|uniref:WbqC family protein n=1 Tax=unclassified Clostridium TaxID=2614128 RepID=UPI000297B01A|nr:MULTISPECIES: WbqC family protein [unclassified Clostridium]EKQ56938.1 MAG: WbqC-like protein [Clostridium sp. Maddingley MBC34-26]
MRVAIMQPYLFPYLGYFQLINCVDKYVLDDTVQFIKGGWINRNRLLINNEAVRFTLSLKKGSARSNINERYLSNRFKEESNRLLKTIEINYKKAPYFLKVMPLICEILDYDNNSDIGSFNYNSIQKICTYMGIKTPLLKASDIFDDMNLKCQDMVIEMVKILNGNVYINAIGGIEIYSKKYFKERAIDLYFIKTNNIEYKQYNNKFIPNLSIVDVLMFNSKEQVKELLNQYTLI